MGLKCCDSVRRSGMVVGMAAGQGVSEYKPEFERRFELASKCEEGEVRGSFHRDVVL